MVPFHSSDVQLKLCTPAHMRVFMHTCVQEREWCVNMLIQAVPVTHSCTAWLRSDQLIILAVCLCWSVLLCVDSEYKVALNVCHPLHHSCQRTTRCLCVSVCNMSVSSPSSLFSWFASIAAIWP